MKFLKHLILTLSIFTFLFSCNSKKTEDKEKVRTSTIKYAKGFDILKTDNKIKLIIKSPYPGAKHSFEYTLSKQKTSKENTIHIPLKSIVVTSTTHVPMLELLNVEDKLVGYPNTNYISSKKTRALINAGEIKELGHEERINTEVLLDLKPDLVVGFSLNSNNKMFSVIEKLGIPVILNGDWLETNPLGRAEWIKFFGVLFDKEKQADSIFKSIETSYIEAKKIAENAKTTPTVVSGGLYKDIWNLPAGDSFEANFLKDANTNYLWKDTQGQGSLSLNIENVFEKGKEADIWVSPSFHISLNDMRKANDIYPLFKAFKNKEVYSFSTKKGEKGGLIYFELSPSCPHLVLKDLIKISHPELMKDYEFTFFEKLK